MLHVANFHLCSNTSQTKTRQGLRLVIRSRKSPNDLVIYTYGNNVSRWEPSFVGANARRLLSLAGISWRTESIISMC